MSGFFYKLGAVYGYHSTKSKDVMPSNLFALSEEDRLKALEWYEQHSPSGSKGYLEKRKDLEKVLYREAVKKLKDIKSKHPLYFVLSNNRKRKPDFDGGNIFEVDPSLFDKATFTGGDSFDFYRRLKDNEHLSDVAAGNVFTYNEMLSLKDNLEKNMLKRKGGNYIEGQLWSPYKVENNKIVLDKELT